MTDYSPQEYISSFSFDQRLAPYDIQGSIAHAQMLSKCGIISSKDSQKIVSGLKSIEKELQKGKRLPKAEDVHFAVEKELVRRIGETGKKMHTARSRNDQVALDLKLYIKDQTQRILLEIKSAQKAVLDCAVKHQKVLMPGFTHLQHGQPIFFAHHILAYAWMLERDKGRFKNALQRADESPLGACALAGTTFPINRQMAAKALGFSRVTENSVDTVSDRDFIIEFVFACSLTMVHLSRLAEEMVIWSSAEFDYLQLAEPLTSGSSIMPQKRNPDTAELLRGKSSRLIGELTQLLSLVKSQPLSYNRDMQEDKPPLFDAAETTLASLSLTEQIFKGLKVNAAKMEKSCAKGFLLATDLADYLTRKGVAFRAAHTIVAGIVKELSQNSKNVESLTTISLSKLKSYSSLFESDVYRFLSPRKAAESRNSYGGTGTKALARQIQKLKSLK